MSEEYLKPPTTKGHTSVAHIADDWYIACQSRVLRKKPLAVTLLGTPLAVFRSGTGEPAALLDRCPHRNAPLSLGKVKNEVLQCSYHGWEFDRSGICRSVPGLLKEQSSRGRHVPAYPTREQDGFVWVYGTPDVKPERDPFRFPFIGERGYTTECREFVVEGSVHATAENALDVPHTAYLHGGLFRSADGTRSIIEVVVRRFSDHVEAEYVGESRPAGLVGRVLSPREDAVTHVDRFTLPSIAQVEYRIGTRTHLCVTSALTPVYDFLTRIFAVVSLRLPIPGWLVAPLLQPIVMHIFGQDARILKQQTENIRRFGGEQFSSTEIDVLGPHIYRLLKEAERGERKTSKEPLTRKVRMLV